MDYTSTASGSWIEMHINIQYDYCMHDIFVSINIGVE